VLGSGVPEDPARGATLLQKACDGADLRGCIKLGMVYEAGLGVPKDEARAAALYRKACDGGEADGCTKLKGTPESGSEDAP